MSHDSPRALSTKLLHILGAARLVGSMQVVIHRMQGILVFKVEMMPAGKDSMHSLAHTDHSGLAW